MYVLYSQLGETLSATKRFGRIIMVRDYALVLKITINDINPLPKKLEVKVEKEVSGIKTDLRSGILSPELFTVI